ncbi:MAG TPA: hypothetical protein VMT24_00725, partial [Aggregatilineaceae bacterium]|nr:hypothetical protein [Aggregatilineaceae bacterium]
MQTRRFGLVILVTVIAALAFAGTGMAWAAAATRSPWAAAQAQPGLPPAIISFTSDLDGIALAEVEAGQTSTQLSWQTVGLAARHRLLLQALRLNTWVSLLPEDAAPLPASGSYDI